MGGVQDKNGRSMAAIGGHRAAGGFHSLNDFTDPVGFYPNDQGGVSLPEEGSGAGNPGSPEVVGHQGIGNIVYIIVADNGNNQFEHG
jgi:hypothetical protein